MPYKATKIPAYKPPKRYAVGTNVRVRNPGVDGVVIHMDEERSVMSEYWHTVKTKRGERREPGCNLEVIREPITNSYTKPHQSKIADNIHFHGDNPRLNVNSTDNSINAAVSGNIRLFEALREKANTISDDLERERIQLAIAEMQSAHGSGGFLATYQQFISTVGDHITVFGPLLPMLAMLLSNHSS